LRASRGRCTDALRSSRGCGVSFPSPPQALDQDRARLRDPWKRLQAQVRPVHPVPHPAPRTEERVILFCKAKLGMVARLRLRKQVRRRNWIFITNPRVSQKDRAQTPFHRRVRRWHRHFAYDPLSSSDYVLSACFVVDLPWYISESEWWKGGWNYAMCTLPCISRNGNNYDVGCSSARTASALLFISSASTVERSTFE